MSQGTRDRSEGSGPDPGRGSQYTGRRRRGGHRVDRDRQAEGHHAEGDQDVRAEGGQEDRARRGKEERSPENGHRSEEIVSGSASGTVE